MPVEPFKDYKVVDKCEGYTRVGPIGYKIIEEKGNQDAAKAKCEGIGAILADIKNKEQHAFVLENKDKGLIDSTFI